MKLSTGQHGRGIKYHDRNQKWEARIMIDGVRTTLGYFDTVEEAENAYKAAKNAKESNTLGFLRNEED